MTLNVIEQADFSGGVWRESEPQTAPANTMYDCVNGLLDDTFSVYRRGGTVYKSAAAALPIMGVSDVHLETARTTLLWTAGNLYRLDSDDSSLVSISTAGTGVPVAFSRPTSVGNKWYAVVGATKILEYDRATDTVAGIIPGVGEAEYVTSVGTPGRLVATYRNQAYFSDNGSTTFDPFNFHELPGGARIIGAEGVGDRLTLFTTIGVFVVNNMNFDLTDDAGNVQQSVQHVDPNLILWQDSGVTEWRGALVVPAIDDVMLFSPGGQTRIISETIRPLYRQYVEAGYRPGMAGVHRGHYFLPILNGTTWVDTLVCRLDRTAWTRWTGGHVAFTERIGDAVRSPKLFAASGTRLLEATSCFGPSGTVKADADGTAHQFSVTTRDYTSRRQIPVLWKYARLRYELTDAGDGPTIAAAKATGRATSSFTSLNGVATTDDGTGPAEWSVDERAQSCRIRFQTTGPAADVRLRSLEMHFRPSNKR